MKSLINTASKAVLGHPASLVGYGIAERKCEVMERFISDTPVGRSASAKKGTVANHFVHSALAPIRARGGDVEGLLQGAGLPLSVLDSIDGRVSAENFAALWLAVAREIDDELFAQDSRRMKAGSFAFLCRSLMHCETLQVALQRMLEFFNLILDDYRFTLDTTDGEVHLVTTELPSATTPRVFGQETLLIMQHGVACWLIGRRIPIAAAHFAYKAPPHRDEYRVMFSESLCFDAEQTMLVFDRHFLDLPIVQSERTARDFLRGAPANLVLKYKNTTGLAAHVRRHLRTGSVEHWPDLDGLAESLHMTRSTLRRRLNDEGQSFQAIKDGLRRDMAIDELSHTDKTISEISAALGFAETSAFHRAFKKWTGQTPSQYRQKGHSRR